jgi:hypothetical protein
VSELIATQQGKRFAVISPDTAVFGGDGDIFSVACAWDYAEAVGVILDWITRQFGSFCPVI